MAAAAGGGRPMPGAHVTFEDLLEREWSSNRHSVGGTDGTTQSTRHVAKKPFLKRGARGWWKDSGKAKPVTYTLSSTHDEDQGESAATRTPAGQQQSPVQPRLRRTHPPSATLIATSSNASTRQVMHTLPPSESRWSDLESKPRRESRVLGASSSRYISVAHTSPPLIPSTSNSVVVREQLLSTWSTHDSVNDDDVNQRHHPVVPSTSHWPSSVAQSFDWKLEQDAQDLEEFESLEQQLLEQHEQLATSTDHWDPGDSSPWTLHQENERRDLLAELDAWSREDIASNAAPPPPALPVYDSAKQLNDTLSNHSFMCDEGELGHQSSILPRSPGSHVQQDKERSLDMSFADSEPWDDPRPPCTTSNSEGAAHQLDASTGAPTKHGEVTTPEPKYVEASYVQQRFQQAAANRTLPPPSSSLQTLKMKLKQKVAASAGSRSKNGSSGGAAKTAAKTNPSHPLGKPKMDKPHPPIAASSTPAAASPLSSRLPHYSPAIDDKLQELEHEVKHYKHETLKLQKRREALEADQRKLDQQRHEWLEEKRKAQDDIDAEWKRIRKERRAVDQALKFGGSLPDRKERAEIDALKAQIVKLQMDDRTKTSKHKAATDFFRHRIAELEMRNDELRDELKFMEQERLANWAWANETQPDKRQTRHSLDSPIAGAPTTAAPVQSRVARTKPLKSHGKSWGDDDVYNPAHYQMPAPATSHTPQDVLASPRSRRSSCDDDADSLHKGMDDAEQDGASPRRHEGAERPASSPRVAKDGKTDDWEEIHHAGGKVERRFSSGPIAKTFRFANGTEKDVFVDGHSVVRFSNGDVKENYPAAEGGKTVYYYAAAQTRHTTYADQTQVFDFPNGQVEKHHANGAKEITFVDGTTKRIETNGDEWSTFPDGTRMVEKKSGFREVINPDGSKARDYPDGRTTWVTPQGVEQPVQYKRSTV
ncbi:hypothetical protein H310_11123 [Aphanomyces invadans]|uniref:Centromere protein J C-terminal domain-containing protein n=1 Tax=Aphanomyces invadans TaxID=157072 RepID=A0A024TQR8_9STRA|nr:hypothetical protein H310_11123 [Aphanomyces invadans]ETV95707.1 hypothetical protein H310_11123 [Aphanomyces invadans]|eukprot:XP_008875900.1 hypothetical protein H310_11123 [Aphanomyces invadans]